MKRDRAALAGAGLALAGVATVEALLQAGFAPYAPIGWPGLGMIAAAALGGWSGVGGAAAVIVPYYVLNLLHPERFMPFFSGYGPGLSWIAGVSLLVALALVLRGRLAQAELAATYHGALRESEERLRVITDNVPALVAYIDHDERYRFNNRAYGDWLGPEHADVTGRSVREVWGGERYALIRPNLELALRGERVSHEYTLPAETGERHILASYVPHADESGAIKGFFVLASDITQLATARAELRAARERLEQALDGSSVALWDADLRTGRVYLSEAWAVIIGEPARDKVVSLKDLTAMVHPDDRESMARVSVEVMKAIRPVYAVEHRVRSASGEWKWILSRGRVTERDAAGRALRMIGTNLDITDRKRIEEALQFVAQTDPLTGLANRTLLMDRLKLALARSRRSGARLALLYLDVDRFKQVNDRLGHAAGDAVLRHFALRLRACVRASDTVARLGGDEFVVLLDELKEHDHALRVAEKILDAMSAPLNVEGEEIRASTSIGLALCAGTEDEERFLKRADDALYEAKRAGRNTIRIAA